MQITLYNIVQITHNILSDILSAKKVPLGRKMYMYQKIGSLIEAQYLLWPYLISHYLMLRITSRIEINVIFRFADAFYCVLK